MLVAHAMDRYCSKQARVPGASHGTRCAAAELWKMLLMCTHHIRPPTVEHGGLHRGIIGVAAAQGHLGGAAANTLGCIGASWGRPLPTGVFVCRSSCLCP
jgi:hypothetical protein